MDVVVLGGFIADVSRFLFVYFLLTLFCSCVCVLQDNNTKLDADNGDLQSTLKAAKASSMALTHKVSTLELRTADLKRALESESARVEDAHEILAREREEHRAAIQTTRTEAEVS